jgi:hypothetical protein
LIAVCEALDVQIAHIYPTKSSGSGFVAESCVPAHEFFPPGLIIFLPKSLDFSRYFGQSTVP